MAKHRTYSIEFKRQIAQEYLSGEESLYGLARRHDICRNLIRIWVGKYEAGEFDEEVEAANLLREYEAHIAALERKVGQLTLENDFLKRASSALRRKNVSGSSVVSGPKVSASPKDAAS
jgi:transposase-like protein